MWFMRYETGYIFPLNIHTFDQTNMEVKSKCGTGINSLFIYLSERLNIIFAVNDKNSGT